jgi:5-methylcytosine-specific restriction endonuclease McrA
MRFARRQRSAASVRRTAAPPAQERLPVRPPAASPERPTPADLDARLRRAQLLGHNALQRYGIDDFSTYSEAKNANPYSKKLLDTQKNDSIKTHFKKGFTPDQADEIYKVNLTHYKQGEIISDADGKTPLFRLDSSIVPHIDHRFPKSKGGSNNYANAQVLPAKENIAKSDKMALDKEPDVPLAPYEDLDKFDTKTKYIYGGEFTAEQRELIKAANRKYYKQGAVVSDADGKTQLTDIDSSQVPNIDHITPKSVGGTNYYFNAQVWPMNENITKGGTKGANFDIEDEVAEMSLAKFYKEKEKGEIKQAAVFNAKDMEIENDNDDF